MDGENATNVRRVVRYHHGVPVLLSYNGYYVGPIILSYKFDSCREYQKFKLDFLSPVLYNIILSEGIMLYIIYAESLNYCGYGQHFVVEAESSEEAEFKATGVIEEFFYDQDSEQLEEDGNEEGPYSDIQSCEELTPVNEHWKWFSDPKQKVNYIEVGHEKL